ncbi:FIST signal transduction protein [Polaromonas sp.]|uniref:FIST signal transduction protein n=1 Tax=Polaromonas sp. TaxID=1869339 RepID=UPI0025CE8A02|nr:FIST N-terminal domain-containing protein [Polaromonas sp.]
MAKSAQLVLVFGSVAVLRQRRLTAAIRAEYSAAHIFGCSTAGEICGSHVLDDSLVVTAVQFDSTPIRSAQVKVGPAVASFEAGEQIARQLPLVVRDATTGVEDKLLHVLVMTDGLKVNGSAFVAGLMKHLPDGVSATGGMAGDGVRFGETLVYRDGVAETGAISALGLYGSRLKVGYGSLGGWDTFDTEWLITRSEANVLYELDGLPALALYKEFLGAGPAKGLPATGLLFPLSLRAEEDETPVVRTILAVDEAAQSITFAGDVPEGAYAQLMQANFSRLIDGATGAARICQQALPSSEPELALLISCVGRRLVLKERVDEEVRAVNNVLGGSATLAGFYSYGEISPFTPGARCELHNQTMTITTFSEREEPFKAA